MKTFNKFETLHSQRIESWQLTYKISDGSHWTMWMLNFDVIVALPKEKSFAPTLTTPLPNIKHHKFGIT